jgi:dynein heavy chain, axonemal
MNSVFETQQANPPLYKNQPPVAGAIHWEKSLFHRIKRTMLQLLPVKEIMASVEGEKAKAKYLGIARRMKAYADNLHREWFVRVEGELPLILKQTLLIRLSSGLEYANKSLASSAAPATRGL